jgi:hypothetical protein
LIGGDVHTAYVAEVSVGERQQSRVFQIVCSPFRNPLRRRERWMVRLLASRAAAVVAGGLARSAGVGHPAASWRVLSGPTFDNSIATLELDERTARVVIRRSTPEEEDGPPLEPIHERDLTPA